MALLIDEQNVATKCKFTLQEYLNTELCVGNEIFQPEISVEYYDSKNSNLIQLADYLANTIFRYLGDGKQSELAKENIELLKPLLVGKRFFEFPPK